MGAKFLMKMQHKQLMISYTSFHLVFTSKLYPKCSQFLLPPTNPPLLPFFLLVFFSEESPSERLRGSEVAQLSNSRAHQESGFAETVYPPTFCWTELWLYPPETSKSCDNIYVSLIFFSDYKSHYSPFGGKKRK